MTVKELLVQLKALGTEKMREHNSKYGAGDNQFGVKMGDIRALAKKIKLNHGLALDLWETGNVDARLLAILIIDPRKLCAGADSSIPRINRASSSDQHAKKQTVSSKTIGRSL